MTIYKKKQIRYTERKRLDENRLNTKEDLPMEKQVDLPGRRWRSVSEAVR